MFTLSDVRRVKTFLDVFSHKLEFCFIAPQTGNQATYSKAGLALITDTLPPLTLDEIIKKICGAGIKKAGIGNRVKYLIAFLTSSSSAHPLPWT
jgi:hypothetical protein